jgi:nitrite reductase/ring-hydroxylating ferredoxin subunit
MHGNFGLSDGFVEGDLIECPALHSAACFEIKTAKAVNPPATESVW